MQYILSSDDHFAHLTDLLKAPSPDSPRAIMCSLPVWWCPWIHDIGTHVILLVTGQLCTLSFKSMILNDSPVPWYCSPPSLVRYYPSHPSYHPSPYHHSTTHPFLTAPSPHPLLTHFLSALLTLSSPSPQRSSSAA